MRATRGTWISAAIAAAMVAQAASVGAQPLRGDNEVQLQGAFFHAQGSDTGTLAVDGAIAHYFDPALQVGLRQGLAYVFVDDADDPWSATTVPFVNYHFRGVSQDDRILPFVGAFGGLIWNDDDATGTVGPTIGAKFFVSPQTFFATQYRYEWFFDDFDRVDNNSDEGNHVVTVGLGYAWGGVGTRGQVR